MSGKKKRTREMNMYSNLCEARASRVRKNMYEAEWEMNFTKGFRMNLAFKLIFFKSTFWPSQKC